MDQNTLTITAEIPDEHDDCYPET